MIQKHFLREKLFTNLHSRNLLEKLNRFSRFFFLCVNSEFFLSHFSKCWRLTSPYVSSFYWTEAYQVVMDVSTTALGFWQRHWHWYLLFYLRLNEKNVFALFTKSHVCSIKLFGMWSVELHASHSNFYWVETFTLLWLLFCTIFGLFRFETNPNTTGFQHTLIDKYIYLHYWPCSKCLKYHLKQKLTV